MKEYFEEIHLAFKEFWQTTKTYPVEEQIIFKAGYNYCMIKSSIVKEFIEAGSSFMNLENDYQAEDTSELHYAVQYWIEEKARRKTRLFIALEAYRSIGVAIKRDQ